MTSRPGHPGDDLQLLIDGRLDAVRREEVQAHLESCDECRDEVARLQTLKSVMRQAFGVRPVPADLAAAVSAMIDAESSSASSATQVPGSTPAAPGDRPFAWAALAAAVLLLGFWLVNRAPAPPSAAPTIVAEVVASGRAWRAGREAPAHVTSATGDLEAYFASELPFHVTVYDLGMMQYRLVGGRVVTVGGRKGAAFAYDSPDGRRVVCYMYLGTMAELPPPDERRTSKGHEFYVYHDGADTVVFWPEQKVICAFIGDLPSDDVVQLAFAKASAL
jgi:anti-sigma factor RsiW